MSQELSGRLVHVRGSAREVGLALGRGIGPRLGQLVSRYLDEGPGRHGQVDWDRLRAGAMLWLRALPCRFQEEIEGLATGSGVPLERLAEWCYVEECAPDGCSAFLCSLGGHVWVGRNNDLWAPDLWGHAIVREVDGRLPTITFGMEGEPFTGTGVNAEQLWLHYNWLPAPDMPEPGQAAMAPFVWLVDALETCRTLDDVEDKLADTPRTGAMMLFAVDGRADTGAVYECTCLSHARRDLEGGRLAGTNHYAATPAHNTGKSSQESYDRYARLDALVEALAVKGTTDAPADLMQILADPAIEQSDPGYGTVYANVACLSQRQVWHTFGGYPAPSAGAWSRIEWPWP